MKKNIPPVDLDLLTFAVNTAKEAGELTLKYFKTTDLVVEGKGDGTPVTEADRDAERLMRTLIHKSFPNDTIKGEEEPDLIGTSERSWVLDPIDGTMSFIHGVPLYGNLISMEDEYGPAIGVINIPVLGECIFAGRGRGCYFNDELTQVSESTTLDGSCIVTSGVDYWPSTEILNQFVQNGAVIRTWGDAYGYVLVATGRADAMIDPIVNHWDVAPMLTIFPEAGGIFSDFSGAFTASGGNALATNPNLYTSIISMLNS
tara:strand:+ start:174 stop:950 length:777 start_codon:yes stop_codon:yes gene_type:complete